MQNSPHKVRRFRIRRKHLKTQIDKLTAEIKRALETPTPTTPEVAMALKAIGVDGPSIATQLRESLVRWSNDETLTAETRRYAKQQLEALPPISETNRWSWSFPVPG